MHIDFEYQVNKTESEIEALKKQPKVYRNNKMIYRLNKKDVLRIKNNIEPNKAEYDKIHSALNMYLNERKNSEIVTNACAELFRKTFKEPKYDKNFYSTVIMTAVSYFYNIPYNQLANVKNLDLNSKTDWNLYGMISYEELDHINRMKKVIVESGTKTPYLSELDAFKFAKEIGEHARNSFINNYGVDPALVEKCEYNCYDIEKFNNELAVKIKNLENSQDQDRYEEL